MGARKSQRKRRTLCGRLGRAGCCDVRSHCASRAADGRRFRFDVVRSSPSQGLVREAASVAASGGDACPFTWYCGASAVLSKQMGWLGIFLSLPRPATLSKIDGIIVGGGDSGSPSTALGDVE